MIIQEVRDRAWWFEACAPYFGSDRQPYPNGLPAPLLLAVEYLPAGARAGLHEAEVERGIITGANDSYVFVRFWGDLHSKPCRPEDLTWVWP